MPEETSPTPGHRAGPGRLVHAAAFAEPNVMSAGDRWWAVGATDPGGRVPTLTSVDLVHWHREAPVLAAPGAWAVPGTVRAPRLLRIGPDRWLLYYTAVVAAPSEIAASGTGRASDPVPVRAIGVAAAAQPGGPFVDVRAAPLLSGAPGREVTEPAVLTLPDRTHWLYWADRPDGQRPGSAPGSIRASPLTGDGLSLVGSGTATVLRAGLSWQGGVVGGPDVLATRSGIVLLYTAGRPESADRCIGLARAGTPAGPCTPDPQPLLASSDAYEGPGHPSWVRDPAGRGWLLFAAWRPRRAGTPGARQRLWLAGLDLAGLDPVRDPADPDPAGPDPADPDPAGPDPAGPVGSPQAVPRVVDPVPGPVPLPAPPGRWRLPVPTEPTPEQEAVLHSFTVHSAIRAVPVRRRARLALLDLLAQLFEPGVRYPESEVDRRLTGIWASGVHPDYARLRRLLVDENFLDRTGGVYRRSGGSVPG